MRRTYYAAIALACVALTAGCKHETSVERSPVKVKVEKVERRAVSRAQSFSGTVEEESGSALSFMTGGAIERICVAQGQTVERGALLAVVDETSLRNMYEAAVTTREQAEDAYSRMKQLHDTNSLPEVQWIDAQSKLKQAVSAERIAKKSLDDCKLYAPYSGFISEKTAEVGQNALPGVPVMKLVKIDRVKVKISVPENEIAGLKKGGKALVSVAALGGKEFSATVAEKGVSANPLSRSYDVKLLVDNPRHELLPGMVCGASLDGSAGAEATAIVLPASVVSLSSDNREFVWLSKDGAATKRYVTTGCQTASGVIVESGLEVGETVIVEGQQKVSEGTKVSF